MYVKIKTIKTRGKSALINQYFESQKIISITADNEQIKKSVIESQKAGILPNANDKKEATLSEKLEQVVSYTLDYLFIYGTYSG